jgi:hypothetical protein
MFESDLIITTILNGKGNALNEPFYTNSVTSFGDYWGSGPGIVDGDVPLGGKENYPTHIWHRKSSTTTIIFNRTLNTGDKVADNPIHKNGTTHLIWSYRISDSDELLYHGANSRGQLIVAVSDPLASSNFRIAANWRDECFG